MSNDIFGNTTLLTNNAKQFQEYATDFIQRSVLFLDVMRKRGNEMVDMTSNKSSTVLRFKFEKIMDGKDFAKPINYWLARMLPPEGVTTDNNKRPYVVQDPRAGQGPGIGGFKKDSEIGDALANGHPVYFVGFNSVPEDKQTYEDIIRGQVKFYEKVAELHPNSPKMCAIGNCAAGYLTMFSAMQRPDIFGPILIAGSPLSYWNGVRGKNPMRYAGGLVGGSWVNSLLGDLGGGKFDGTYLIMNFNLLSLANFLWTKQYDLYNHVDKEGERYLEFEKWWGDFIQFNTSEIKWLVDKLFIGNELTTGNLTTEDGIRLDPRLITSPLITFVSDGDNISPPAQSAGWIADLYKDTAEIVASGKTIVYCLNHKVGHLAIFTATKVGKREDEMFVENMDSIDILPPGLYELVVDTVEGSEEHGKLVSHYEPRTIEDIKALGWNSEEDDRAFATVAKASEAISQMYDKMVHPLFRVFANKQFEEAAKKARPLRISYTAFADKFNPFMKGVELAAQKVEEKRKPAAENNPFIQWQNEYSNLFTNYLNNFTQLRDSLEEQAFFSIWSNPLVQKFWGTYQEKPRYTPSESQLNNDKLLSEYKKQVAAYFAVKDDATALIRLIVLFSVRRHYLGEFLLRETVAEVEKINPKLSVSDIKELIKQNAMAVREDNAKAVTELRKFLTDKIKAREVFDAASIIYQKLHTDHGIEFSSEVQHTLSALEKELGLVK